jgi:hypothetical protein
LNRIFVDSRDLTRRVEAEIRSFHDLVQKIIAKMIDSSNRVLKLINRKNSQIVPKIQKIGLLRIDERFSTNQDHKIKNDANSISILLKILIISIICWSLIKSAYFFIFISFNFYVILFKIYLFIILNKLQFQTIEIC